MPINGSTVKRGQTKTKRKTKKRKPRCELGAKCPYIHQYQHSLEYDHGGDDSTAVSENSTASFRAFSGAGHTTLSSSSTSRLAPRRTQRFATIQGAAAAAAMRRAAVANIARATNSQQTHAEHQQEQHASRKNSGTHDEKRQDGVIVLNDSDEEDKSNIRPLDKNRIKDASKAKGSLPPMKRARNTYSASIIDLCDSSDED